MSQTPGRSNGALVLEKKEKKREIKGRQGKKNKTWL